MQKPALHLVVASLPHYSRSELIVLKNKINAALTDSREERQSLENEDWLLHGLLEELRQKGELVNDRFKLKSSQSFRHFESRSEDVKNWLLPNFPDFNAVQLRAVGELCGRELIRYLQTIGRPIKLDEVLNNVHLIPRAINMSFPGHVECGMFGMVVKRIIKG